MKQPQATILGTTNESGRADFTKSAFDLLITEKGRTVTIETALSCPCKSEQVGNLSSCKNCGGTGWIFVNPVESRVVIQAIEVATKLEGWSEENRGMARFSALAEDKLSYMDRLTLKDGGTSTYGEVLHFKKKAGVIFAYAAYDIVALEYAGMWIDGDSPLTKLDLNTDYTFDGRIFKLDSTKYADIDLDTAAVTIRYDHFPQFHVFEMKRDTMQSFKFSEGLETPQILPVSGYARRAHYQIDAPNLNGDNIINNDY